MSSSTVSLNKGVVLRIIHLWMFPVAGYCPKLEPGGPSGRVTNEVDSDDTEEVDSEETHVVATTKAMEAESDKESHRGEGMLIKNPRSSVMHEDVRLWRYLYRISPNVEIRVPSSHERVDWIVPRWVAMDKLMLKDGMMFLIPRLVKDVCDHYEIVPSQLMPDA